MRIQLHYAKSLKEKAGVASMLNERGYSESPRMFVAYWELNGRPLIPRNVAFWFKCICFLLMLTALPFVGDYFFLSIGILGAGVWGGLAAAQYTDLLRLNLSRVNGQYWAKVDKYRYS